MITDKNDRGSGKVTVEEAAKILGLSTQTVRLMLQQQVVEWGVAFKRPGSSLYTYVIYKEAFLKLTGN